MYTTTQIKKITEEFKRKISLNQATEYETLIAILIMEKMNRISVEDIPDILMNIFNKDKIKILNTIKKVQPNLNDELIEKIVKEIEE